MAIFHFLLCRYIYKDTRRYSNTTVPYLKLQSTLISSRSSSAEMVHSILVPSPPIPISASLQILLSSSFLRRKYLSDIPSNYQTPGMQTPNRDGANSLCPRPQLTGLGKSEHGILVYISHRPITKVRMIFSSIHTYTTCISLCPQLVPLFYPRPQLTGVRESDHGIYFTLPHAKVHIISFSIGMYTMCISLGHSYFAQQKPGVEDRKKDVDTPDAPGNDRHKDTDTLRTRRPTRDFTTSDFQYTPSVLPKELKKTGHIPIHPLTSRHAV